MQVLQQEKCMVLLGKYPGNGGKAEKSKREIHILGLSGIEPPT
jgi:hypothetical protein